MLTREEANALLQIYLKNINENLEVAKKLAEEHDLEFSIELDKPMYFREIATLEWAASSNCEWETSNEYSYDYGWSEKESDF